MSIDLILSLSIVFLAVVSLVVKFLPRKRGANRLCGCDKCPVRSEAFRLAKGEEATPSAHAGAE